MIGPETNLSGIFPPTEGKKPTKWGEPIPIRGFGKVGMEVSHIHTAEKDITLLQFIWRNKNASVILGAPRGPLHVHGTEAVMSNPSHLHLPQTFKEAPLPFNGEPGKEEIITGFSSRTLTESLYALNDSHQSLEERYAMTLFLLLKTVQIVKDLHDSQIPGDLQGNNIIVDDSLQVINPIDANDAETTFGLELYKVINIFSTIFTRLHDSPNDASAFARNYLPLPPIDSSNAASIREEDRIIQVTKQTLTELGYPVETSEEQTATAVRLASNYRRIQITQRFLKQDPPIMPTDKQVTSIIKAMDQLVQTVPTVKIPG